MCISSLLFALLCLLQIAKDNEKSVGSQPPRNSTVEQEMLPGVAEILKEYGQYQIDFNNKRNNISKGHRDKTPAEKGQLIKELMLDKKKKDVDTVCKLMSIIRKEPRHAGAPLGLQQVIAIQVPEIPETREAAELLLQFHAGHRLHIQACIQISYFSGQWVNEYLEKVLLTRPENQIQAEIKAIQAQMCTSTINAHENLKKISAKQLKNLADLYGKDHVDRYQSVDTKQLESKAAALYQEIIDKYPMHKLLSMGNGNEPAEKMARSALYELRYLKIGKKAPEIEGIDIDGRSFKLSDYLGKVIVLDFWGDW